MERGKTSTPVEYIIIVFQAIAAVDDLTYEH
jgi:hypothetical protein